MATRSKIKKMTPEEYRMNLTKKAEEYGAYLEKVKRSALSEAEWRKRLGEIIKRNAKKRDVGDFDSTAVLRLMRDGKLDY